MGKCDFSNTKTDKGEDETILKNTEEDYNEKQREEGTGNQNLKLNAVTKLLFGTKQHTSSFWALFLSIKNMTKLLFLPSLESGCNDQVK